MAGRNTSKNGRLSTSNSASNIRTPPTTANGMGRGATSAYGFGTHSLMDILSGVSSPGPTASISRGDKTVCQFCGVSYLTMSEMKALQTTVKEQEERLKHYKNMMEENSRLKESLEAARKEGQKSDDDGKQRKLLENEIKELKKQLQASKGKSLDLEQKYSIASDDSRQQEELIASLREDLNELRETQAENATLQKKVSQLSVELDKVHSQSELKEKVSRKNSAGDVGHDQEQPNSGPELKQTHSKAKCTSSPSQESIEMYDLKKLNGYLTDKVRTITDEHSSCHDMHSFLRETVDKLKNDNMGLHEEVNGLKVKFQQAVVELGNMEAKCKGMNGESERLKQTMADMEQKLEEASEQNRLLISEQSPSEMEVLQKHVAKLEKKVQDQKQEIEEMNTEYEKRLSDQQRETNIEKERADSCLSQILVEREEIEKRWEDRWNRHQTSLNEQLDSLKSYYEQTVQTAKEIEEGLQRDLKVVKEHGDKCRNDWDASKVELNAQIMKLKAMHREKSDEFDALQKVKIAIEVMLQDKNEEMDLLQEMVREGCEERQELQKKIEQLEEYIEEMRKGNQQNRPSLLFQQHRSQSQSESPTPKESTPGQPQDSFGTMLMDMVNRNSRPTSAVNGPTQGFSVLKPSPVMGIKPGTFPQQTTAEISSSSSSKESFGKPRSSSIQKNHTHTQRQRESVSRLSTPKGAKSTTTYGSLSRKFK